MTSSYGVNQSCVRRPGTNRKSIVLLVTKVKSWTNATEAIIKSSGGMMEQINEAINIMEQDQMVASKCGKGLVAWKKVKKEHIKQIERLKDAAQLTLGFKMGE